ncbi:MAG: abscisic acid-deficient protein Aba4 family protein, partial [Alphaproteobacteria bacterium]
MTPESLFAMTGPPVLLGWAILILAPRRFAFVNAVPQLLIPVGLSLIYGVLVLRYFAGAGGGFGSLAEVRQLFTSDWALLAGW